MNVWPVWVRALHLGLMASVIVAWCAGEPALRWHEGAGYVALALVALRCLGGWRGGHYVRFAQFVRSPAAVRRYAAAVVHRREARHLGHNPLGGWMVLALLACVALVSLTGWLYTLDMFWGLAWLEWLHRVLAWSLLGLIGLHVAGVAFTSWRHRENLPAAMLSGRKRAAGDGDVA